ncbi:hypothetical protein Tco_1363000 [Tanacetum coccineum]
MDNNTGNGKALVLRSAYGLDAEFSLNSLYLGEGLEIAGTTSVVKEEDLIHDVEKPDFDLGVMDSSLFSLFIDQRVLHRNDHEAHRASSSLSDQERPPDFRFEDAHCPVILLLAFLRWFGRWQDFLLLLFDHGSRHLEFLVSSKKSTESNLGLAYCIEASRSLEEPNGPYTLCFWTRSSFWPGIFSKHTLRQDCPNSKITCIKHDFKGLSPIGGDLEWVLGVNFILRVSNVFDAFLREITGVSFKEVVLGAGDFPGI